MISFVVGLVSLPEFPTSGIQLYKPFQAVRDGQASYVHSRFVHECHVVFVFTPVNSRVCCVYPILAGEPPRALAGDLAPDALGCVPVTALSREHGTLWTVPVGRPGGRFAGSARSVRGWGSSVPRPDGRWGGQVDDWSNPVLPQRHSVVYCTGTGEGGPPLYGENLRFDPQ